MAEHNETGKLGEEIARTFLMKQGFSFVEANFRTRFGEIDIIARKGDKTHFVEVKSVKVQSLHMKLTGINPVDNLTRSKWEKLLKTMEIYASSHKIQEGDWQPDLACVYIDMNTRQAKVELLENILVE